MLHFKRFLVGNFAIPALAVFLAGAPAVSHAMGSGPKQMRYCAPQDPIQVDPNRPFQITPATLRQRITDSNLDVERSLNGVYRAKDQVNTSRANLFPQLNLSAITQFSGPNFLLSAVSVMMPFLIPDNWFALDISKDQLTAQMAGYQLVELNSFASAYALYVALITDRRLLDLLQTSVNDWHRIVRLTEDLSKIGMAAPGSLDLARSQEDLARLRLQKVNTQAVQHLADLRFALVLNATQQVSIPAWDVPPSPYERTDINTAVELAMKGSPEVEQIQALVQGAQVGVKSAKWSFITGASLTQNPGAAGAAHGKASPTIPNMSFKNDQIGGSFTFGLDIFPRIELKKRDVTDLMIRTQEIQQEFIQTIEIASGQLPLAIQRMSLASSAENSLRRNYNVVLDRYRLNLASLLDVIQARLGIEGASTERLAAQSDLSLARINFHRIFRTDEFQNIRGCNLQQATVAAKRN